MAAGDEAGGALMTQAGDGRARRARRASDPGGRVRHGVGRVAGAVVLAGAVAGAAGCDPAPCERLPVHTVPAGASEFPPAPWPEEGTARPSPLRALDTDGDGVEDTTGFDDAAPSLTVTRAAGELVLTAGAPIRPGLGDLDVAGGLTPGDVDGDGRSDLVVEAGGVRYLVPGATTDGTHALADAGVRLFAAPLGGSFQAVGDQDGDGTDDIALQSNDQRTYVMRGPAFAAPGPGGTLEPPYDDVIAEVSGHPVGVVALSPTVDAAVMTDDGAESLTLVARGGQLVFPTGRGAQPYGPGVDVTMADGPDGQAWLVADVWARYSGARHVWDLTNPCGPATPPPPD